MSGFYCEVLACIKDKDFENAFVILKNLEKKSPLTWHRAYLLGFCLKQLGDLPESIIYFKKSLAIMPRQPLTYNGMGISYQDMGNLRQAKCCFNESIKLLSIKYFPEWSSYSIMCKTLLSEALNSTGVVNQRLSKTEFNSRKLMLASLDNHLEALKIESEIIKFRTKNPKHLKNELFGENYLRFTGNIQKSLEYESPNFTIFRINVAAQMFRMGNKNPALKYVDEIKNDIDEWHPHWNLVVDLLRRMREKRKI